MKQVCLLDAFDFTPGSGGRAGDALDEACQYVLPMWARSTPNATLTDVVLSVAAFSSRLESDVEVGEWLSMLDVPPPKFCASRVDDNYSVHRGLPSRVRLAEIVRSVEQGGEMVMSTGASTCRNLCDVVIPFVRVPSCDCWYLWAGPREYAISLTVFSPASREGLGCAWLHVASRRDPAEPDADVEPPSPPVDVSEAAPPPPKRMRRDEASPALVGTTTDPDVEEEGKEAEGEESKGEEEAERHIVAFGLACKSAAGAAVSSAATAKNSKTVTFHNALHHVPFFGFHKRVKVFVEFEVCLPRSEDESWQPGLSYDSTRRTLKVRIDNSNALGLFCPPEYRDRFRRGDGSSLDDMARRWSFAIREGVEPLSRWVVTAGAHPAPTVSTGPPMPVVVNTALPVCFYVRAVLCLVLSPCFAAGQF